MATTAPKTSSRPSAPPKPAPAPAAPVPAVAAAADPEMDAPAAPEPAGPVIERISIGSLTVKKTVYNDGEQELIEMKTLRKGPDERYKDRSWRHAQSI